MAFGEKNVQTVTAEKREQKRKEREKLLYGGGTTGNGEIRKVYKTGVIVDLPVDLIDLNEDNEKTFNMKKVPNIAKAIKEHGYNRANPIAVYEKPDGRYEVNEGHTRFLANLEAGNSTIPAVIKEAVDESTRIEELILSNVNNREFTAMDWARTIELYINKVIKPRNIQGDAMAICAQAFGKGRTSIYRYRQLFKLDPMLQELAEDNRIPYVPLADAVNLSKEYQKELYDVVKNKLENEEEGTHGISNKYLQNMIDVLKNQQRQKEEKESEIEEEITSQDAEKIVEIAKETIDKAEKYIEGIQDSKSESEEKIQKDIINDGIISELTDYIPERNTMSMQDRVFESTVLQLEQINSTDITVGNKDTAIKNLSKIIGICNNLLKVLENM